VTCLYFLHPRFENRTALLDGPAPALQDVEHGRQMTLATFEGHKLCPIVSDDFSADGGFLMSGSLTALFTYDPCAMGHQRNCRTLKCLSSAFSPGTIRSCYEQRYHAKDMGLLQCTMVGEVKGYHHQQEMDEKEIRGHTDALSFNSYSRLKQGVHYVSTWLWRLHCLLMRDTDLCLSMYAEWTSES
jgi:hypothetical protein